jgi:hypothetical protein
MRDVAVGLPHAGVVKTDMATSLALTFGADARAANRLGPILHMKSALLILNANMIVREFLDRTTCEWLWCVEWDHELRLETLYALLAAQKRVIGAMYFIEYLGSIRPCASVNGGNFRPINSFKTGEIMPVAHLGMGCTLIHRSVLEKMRAEPDEQAVAPYWWYDEDPGLEEDGHPIRHGHDISFCLRAARAGFQVYLHTGCITPHLDKGRTLDLKAYLAQDAVKECK